MIRALFILIAVCVVCGCADLLPVAGAVNNTVTDQLNDYAPKLREKCVDGMKKVETKEALAKLDSFCEPATLAYDAAGTGVQSLRAAILAAAAGDFSGLLPAMQKVIALAKDLGLKMGALPK